LNAQSVGILPALSPRSEPMRRRLRRTDWHAKVADVQSDGFKLDDAARVLEVITMHGIDRGDWTHECSDRYIVEQLGHEFGKDKVMRIRHALTKAGLITVVRKGRQMFEQRRLGHAGRWARQGGYLRVDCLMPRPAKSFAVANSDDVVRSVPTTMIEAGGSNVLGASGDALSVRSELVSFGNGAGHVLDDVIAPIAEYTNGVNDMTSALLNARFSIDAEERDRWLARAATLTPPSLDYLPHRFMYCPLRGVGCSSPGCKRAMATYAARRAAADAAEVQRIADVAQTSAADRERERAEAHAHFATIDPFTGRPA
jgi:hypothetical protein